MNIAFLLKKFHPEEVDAAVTTVFALGNELQAKGHNVIIITDRGLVKKDKKKQIYERTEKEDEFRGIKIYRPYAFPQPKSRSFLNFPYVLERAIAPGMGVRYVEKKLEIKFDVVHSFGGAYSSVLIGYFGKLFSKNKKIKFVHTIKAYSLYDKHWFSPGSLFWARMLNLADVISVPTQRMKKVLVKAGVKSKKLSIVYSYINLEKFKPLNKKVKLKKKLGFEGKKLVLYYGQWGFQKGVHILIKNVKSLLDEDKRIHLFFAHPTHPSKKDLELYKKHEVKGRMTLSEGRLDIVEYINAADVVVLPYLTIKGTETNPLCILESISCKTPVVSINFEDIAELFENKKEILLAKPGDFNAFKVEVLRVLNDSKLAKKLSDSAYKKKHLFDIKEASKKFFKLYS